MVEMMGKKTKNSILLVAVGGIGFRHFQALLNCKSDFDIHVVDISADAIEKAKSYAEGQAHGKTVYYYSSISDLEAASCFQIAIIATSSLPRRKIFEDIVARCTVQAVIFEKVLFPCVDDYSEVGKLLSEKRIIAYVNCIRRVQPFYRQLREELRHTKILHAQVRGSNWGLACNSIHMIDFFAYLSSPDARQVSCNGSLLEEKIFDSKRKGYIEFYGQLTGRIGEDTTYLVECDHGQMESIIELTTESAHYHINESDGLMVKRSLESGTSVERRFKLLFVSQTTTGVVDELLSGKAIGLTNYAESVKLHLPILQELLKKQNKIRGSESTLCPIT